MILLGAAIPALPMTGAGVSWDTTVPSGNWSAPTSWAGGQVPTSGDEVDLNSDESGDPFSAQFDLAGSIQYGNVYVQDSGAGEFRVRIDDPTLTFSSQKLFLGYAGAGRIVHVGGNVNVGTDLVMGSLAGSLGAYELSGGTLNTLGTEYVGGQGQGTFVQSGGVNNVGLILSLSSNDVNPTSYTLSGNSTLNVTKKLFVAGETAVFTQSGGTSTAGQVTVDGTYNLQGGTLNAAGGLSVGDGGPGKFVFSGGQLKLSGGGISLGTSEIGVGTFTMTNGASISNVGTLNVGVRGGGVFNQYDGSLTLVGSGFTRALVLGANQTAGGVYNLHDGGTLIVNGDEDIGETGSATFRQTGGLHTVASPHTLYVGDGIGVTACNYFLSGGTLQANLIVGLYRTASFNQTGGSLISGTITVNMGTFTLGTSATLQATTLTLGEQGEGSTFTLNGGDAHITNNVYMNDEPSVFDHQAGSLTVDNFLFVGYAYGAGTNATYTLTSGHVRVKNQAYVGFQRRGAFIQNGGDFTVDNALFIGTYPDIHGDIYDNTYTLNSGTLNAFIQMGYTNGTHAVLNQTGGVINSKGIEVGLRGTASVNMTGGTMNADFLDFGDDGGTGTFNHSGGVVNVGTNSLTMGWLANGVQTYNMSNGANLTVKGEFQVGASGKAIFNQTGGVVHHANPGFMIIANGTGSTGIYNLSGGSLMVDNGLYVGFEGGATFNQSGGSVSSPYTVEIDNADKSGAPSTYNLADGTINSEILVVGRYSGGTFNQTNGAIVLSFGLLLASQQNSGLGTFNMRGGTIDSPKVVIGTFGPGVFNQYGGSVSATAELTVGSSSSNLSTLNLMGGQSHTSLLRVGYVDTSHGSVVLSGGTLTADAQVLIGDLMNASGTVTVNSGMLSAGQVIVGNDNSAHGTFTQGGGTTNIDSLILANAPATVAAATISDGIFNTAHDEKVGLAGAGVFTQTGGAHSIGGKLIVGADDAASSGAYLLSGGSLTAAAIEIHATGSFIHTGGTFATPAFTVTGGSAVLGAGQSWPVNASLAATGGSLALNTDAGSTGAAHLALDVSGTDTIVTINANQHLRSAHLSGGQTTLNNAAVLTTAALKVEGSGRLDIGRGGIIVDYADVSPLADIRAAIVSGFNAGGARWGGVGIVTSAPVENAALTIGYAEASTLFGPDGGTFLGQSVDGSAVVVRSTLAGDADLDGKVGFSDLVAVAQNYGRVGDGTWVAGDFDYDGDVGFSDLVAVAQNYGGVMDGTIAGASVEFQHDLAAAFATVPEPSSMGLLTLVACGWGRRRRDHAIRKTDLPAR